MNVLSASTLHHEMGAVVQTSLGVPWSAQLQVALGASLSRPDQFEASVRSPREGLPGRGGRMMLEDVSLEAVSVAAAALGVVVPPSLQHLAQVAATAGLPLIGGWDVGGAQPIVKLYLNASDASVAIRRRLPAALGLPSLPPGVEAPHVIGLNACRDGRVETKVYIQGQDELAMATLAGRGAVRLAEQATLCGSAGAIVSWDVASTGARPRAFFITTRDGADAAVQRWVRRLPGWDDSALARQLPFAPGPVRSIGVSADDGGGWTVYFKPRGSARPAHSLEPTARFRAGSVEVGIFVEPTDRAERAYTRTTRHAVSYRCREGAPAPPALELLMTWAVSRVAAAESAGQSPESHFVGERSAAPPSPWYVVTD